MFQTNIGHRQGRMFSAVNSLSATARKILETSWASTFYKDFFCKIDETILAPLYSTKKSRPNTPVNILIGFEALKSAFGWSDEELYGHFLFDMQVRYSLGIHDFDEEYFDIRTVYNFRAALCRYEEDSGINLIQKVIEKITDCQIDKFKLKTGLQRMDSTLIQSNIQNMSRIQLLVQFIINFHKRLTDDDKKKYLDRFALYIKEDSMHYCYRLKRDEAKTRLVEIGEDIQFFVKEFKDQYGNREAYKKLNRAFEEHYRIEASEVIPKTGNKELKGSTLQSPYDQDATYRNKSGEGSKGYVANITETCDPSNALQLITTVSVEPNITDDQVLMASDLDNLSERMEVKKIVTDGGYIGKTASESAKKHSLKHSVTALKGRKKDENKLGFDDFNVETDEEGIPISIKWLGNICGELKTGKPGKYSAGFDSNACKECPLKDKCYAKKLKKKDLSVIRFTNDSIRVANQGQQFRDDEGALNIRASVESTVRSVIHPFGGHLCKMPVRGQIRIKTMTILSATMVNIRRITEYLSLIENAKCPKLTTI